MPFNVKSVQPVYNEFTITHIPDRPEVSEDNPLCGAFRQADILDLDKRDSLLSTPVTQSRADAITWTSVPALRRQLIDIFCSLSELDVTVGDKETPLLKFKDANGVKKLNETFEDFKRKLQQAGFGQAYINTLHEEALAVNPDWSLELPAELLEGND